MTVTLARFRQQSLLGAVLTLGLSSACGKSVAGQGGSDPGAGDGGGGSDQGSGGELQGATGGDANSGPCDEGELSCLDRATPAVCDSNGEWIALPLCPGDTPICATGACTVCEPGAFECQGNAPALCKADGSGFDVGEECSGDTPACLLSARGCGRCAQGSADCQDNAVVECDDGAWIQSQQCSGQTPYCLAGECVECAGADARDCADDTPRLCVEGEWVPEAPCDGEEPVCVAATGRCGCTVGAKKCRATDTPETCSADHVWENNGERCFGHTPVCDEGTCICSEGQARCENERAVTVCEDGAWSDPTACPSATPVCTGDGECVECAAHDDCEGEAVACVDNRCISTYVTGEFISCGDEVCEVARRCCASGATPSCFGECVFTCSDEWGTYGNRILCDGDNDCAAGLQCRALVNNALDCPNGAVGSTCTDTGEGPHACDPNAAEPCPTGETCSLVWPDQVPTFYACQ